MLISLFNYVYLIFLFFDIIFNSFKFYSSVLYLIPQHFIFRYYILNGTHHQEGIVTNSIGLSLIYIMEGKKRTEIMSYNNVCIIILNCLDVMQGVQQ